MPTLLSWFSDRIWPTNLVSMPCDCGSTTLLFIHAEIYRMSQHYTVRSRDKCPLSFLGFPIAFGRRSSSLCTATVGQPHCFSFMLKFTGCRSTTPYAVETNADSPFLVFRSHLAADPRLYALRLWVNHIAFHSC